MQFESCSVARHKLHTPTRQRLRLPARPKDGPEDRLLQLEGRQAGGGGGRAIEGPLAPWQMVALVGESGSGKSTVVGLLQRFYAPTGGEVAVDGAAIEGYRM